MTRHPVNMIAGVLQTIPLNNPNRRALGFCHGVSYNPRLGGKVGAGLGLADLVAHGDVSELFLSLIHI